MKRLQTPNRQNILTVLSLLGSVSIAFAGTYQVQSGDTLWRISKQHKVSVEELQQANKLPNFKIELGQVLIIPDQKKAPEQAPLITEKREKPARLNAVSHRVVHGESLWSIAQKYHTTIEVLQKRNHLKSNVLETGQILLIAPPRVVEQPKQEPAVAQSPSNNKPPKAIPVADLEPKTGMATETTAPKNEKLETEVAKEETPKLAVEEPKIDPLAPLPPVPVIVETPTQRGLNLLTTKQAEAVRQQILLDRNGMGPGIIDGYPGNFTKTSLVLAQKNRPNTFTGDTALFIETEIPKEVELYINPDLPGTGKRPDFKQATTDQCLMMYQSSLEMLAERYHTSEKLLEKLNPNIDFAKVVVGSKILVPNVTEFKIEEFMNPEGEAVTYRYTRSTRKATHVDVDYRNNRIMVWYNNGSEDSENELLASFPVTTNIKKGPKSQRTIAYFAPAPNYMRKKTGLKLKPGPNSPVGIVWAKLGDGFGIHGTSDGSGNGYNTSSGCIRLSNWDMAIFVKIVPSKTKVNFITDKNTATLPNKKVAPTTASVTNP